MYSRVIMGIQWIVRWSMLLYFEGTVIPLKVIIYLGIQWIVLRSILLELSYHLKSSWASSGWWAALVAACVWNTKAALILSGCTFSLYYFVNLPFTVFQVNILYNGKFARCTLLKCSNAYCLLGGQFHIHKFSIPPRQIYNFTLSNHHFHISTFTLQTWQVYIILRAA